MKKFGLIGHPIAHSLSPALFKAAYDGKYTYDLIEGEDFEKAYDRFLQEYDAINVTAPFKELAYRKADTYSPECEVIGAANILIKTEDGIMAANSDQMGVMGAVQAGLSPDRRTNVTALIVGCGGAAKAAAYAMCCSGYQTIIINRSYEKARDFANRLAENQDFNVMAVPMKDFSRWFRKAGVIVYTLPVIIPAISELGRSDIRGRWFCGAETKVLVEANYKDPAFTPEITAEWQKTNKKLTFVSGKEWLLHQAVGAYRSFTGEEPNIGQMRKVL